MTCVWSNISVTSDDPGQDVITISGNVQGCGSDKIVIVFPSDESDDIPLRADGSFSKQIKHSLFESLECGEPPLFILKCPNDFDETCVWRGSVNLECICATPFIEIAPLGEHYMGADQFSVYEEIALSSDTPAPGCNINGDYKFLINLQGIDADIEWRVQIHNGSDSPAVEINNTANKTEITYNLNVSHGENVTILAIVSPRGEDSHCPITVLTVELNGCGCLDCINYGYHESSENCQCQRCPDGQRWDPLANSCIDGSGEPRPDCPDGQHRDQNGNCVPDEPPTDGSFNFCAGLLVAAVALLLIGGLAVIIGVCIQIPWVWIAGAVAAGLGLILFIIWIIFCRRFTPCNVMRRVHCFLFWIVAVVAPIITLIAAIVGIPCGIAAAGAWAGWGTIYAWLGFNMRRVDCIPTC